MSRHFFMYQTEIGKEILKAKSLLEKGEVVAIPTETVYGLAANALDVHAVAKIYEVKNRPQFNPLIVHVANKEQLMHFVHEVPEDFLKLMDAFSPGALTYLLNKSDLIPDITTAGSNKVAVRIPDHPIALGLLSSLSFPLAAPSANLSGYVSPVSAQHVFEGLSGKIPYILDGEISKVGIESTIVGIEQGQTVIHRLGGISKDDLEKVLGKSIAVSITHDTPETPGQLKSHYATKKPLVIGDINKLMIEYIGKKIGILSFKNSFTSEAAQVVLSTRGDVAEAASKLFSAMRYLDQQDIDMILAEYVPETGVGMAVNDRLRRAAH